MNRLILLLCIAALGLYACQPGEMGTVDPKGPAASHVLVIGVDGMSPDGIRNAPTPVMDSLMAGGAYSLNARGVLPTSSSTNWASMVMGVGPEQHGITSNGWERDDYTLPPVVMGDEGIFPTVFGVVRKGRPKAEIGAIYHWDGFGRLIEKTACDKEVRGGSEYKTAEVAAAYIREKKPDFLFVHLDHVDGAGHGKGHGSPEYYTSVSSADSLIGDMLAACRDAGMMDDLVVIVSSDHGGVGFGHGGETLAEIEIPFIVWGKGVKKGFKIPHTVYTYDNPATVAFALGIEAPYAWIGRPVKSAFEGFSVPQEEVRSLLPAPVIRPRVNSWGPGGGLFIDQQATVEIEALSEGTVHFTLDGSTPTADSPVYEKPFSLNKTTVVRAKLFNGKDESIIGDGFFRIISKGDKVGLRYRYIETAESWEVMENFTGLKAAASGQVYEVGLDSVPHRDGNYAVQFTGKIQIPKSGEYKFFTASDDGSKLYINGKQVVNNDGQHGTKERNGKIKLEKGSHALKVEYFQGHGGAELSAMIKGPGMPKQVIPANLLRPE